jgi:hypothetical protein
MGIKIEFPQGNAALTEFVQFHDQLYEYRDARWPAPLELQLPIFTGESPFTQKTSHSPRLSHELSWALLHGVSAKFQRSPLTPSLS